MFRRRQNTVLVAAPLRRSCTRTAAGALVTVLTAAAPAGVLLGSIAPATAHAAPAATAEYVVKDGDYLVGIARKLGTSLTQLLAANGLTVDSVVHPGDHLMVPAGATNPGAGAAAAPAAPAATATYTVKPGDSLFVIARKLGTPFADLLTTNGLTDKSVILPGDVLNVPASATNPGAGAVVASTSAGSTGAAAAASATSSYVVQSGDYLFGIAKKYDISISTLLQLNGLTLESTLLPGATLQLPAGAVAASPTPPPADATPSTKIDAVIAFARAQLGKPYRFNAAGPEAFDCSGLTAAAYAQIGLLLPHQSLLQSNRGVAVDWRTEDIKAGDLVFMFSSNNPNVISHVGLAINSWQWIQAPRAGDVVRLGLIPNDNVIQAVRRYVTA